MNIALMLVLLTMALTGCDGKDESIDTSEQCLSCDSDDYDTVGGGCEDTCEGHCNSICD